MRPNTRLFSEIVSLVFILLFIYTAFHKFTGIDASRHVLHRYPVIRAYPLFFSWALPITEVTMASLLYFKKTNLIGLLMTTVFMGTLTLYVAFMLLKMPHLPCTCGGFISALSWPQHLVLKAVLTLLSFVALLMKMRQPKYADHGLSYSS